MFSYCIIKNPSFKIRKKVIDAIFKNISNIIVKKQKWILNIVFLDTESIKKLNNKYRKKDKPTDVLSFHYFKDFENLKQKDIAWEIIICEKILINQGKKNWLWSEKEFYRMLIHSILHIIGYNHEEDEDYEMMQKLEDKIWKSLELDKINTFFWRNIIFI